MSNLEMQKCKHAFEDWKMKKNSNTSKNRFFESKNFIWKIDFWILVEQFSEIPNFIFWTWIYVF